MGVDSVGSNIALSHWQSQSPLTQGWRYRAARDFGENWMHIYFDGFPRTLFYDCLRHSPLCTLQFFYLGHYK